MNITVIVISILAGITYVGFVIAALRMAEKRKKLSRQTLITERSSRTQNYTSSYTSKDDILKSNAQKKAKSNIAKKLKNTNAAVNSEGLSLSSVKYMLIQAGLETPMVMFWIYSMFSGVLFFGLAQYFDANLIIAICTTIFGVLGFPRFVLKKKVEKRQKKFLEDMPDCLEAMVRLLKSGMPISEAISMTSKEFSGPIGEEITKVYEAQRIGDTLPEAMQALAFRVPTPEVQMFATAIIIQVQTGSSLAEVLQNLSDVIRQRFRLRRKVKALSSEAKASASIIAALPISVAVGMYFLNYDYVSILWIDDFGKTLIYGSIGFMTCGVLIMRQMINFKI